MTDPHATPEPGFCELVQALETAALANSHCPTAFYYDALSAAREALKLYHLNALRRVEAKWRRTARSASGAADKAQSYAQQVDRLIAVAARAAGRGSCDARDRELLNEYRGDLIGTLMALHESAGESCQ